MADDAAGGAGREDGAGREAEAGHGKAECSGVHGGGGGGGGGHAAGHERR